MLVVNVGSDERNHRVRELAEAVAAAVPGTRVSINQAAQPDARSYRVDFGLFRELAPEHQPRFGLEDSITGLVAGLRAIGFSDAAFRSGRMMRLNTLAGLIDGGRLGVDLRWCGPVGAGD
ncbi:MAG: hypothetical protein JO122_05625 [Acetobacteraceae bacterium]|nr:hypothetical protein [Acetobacteraceae bacterium]